GTVVDGSHTPQAATSLYSFTGAAGQRLFLDVIAGQNEYRLLAPDGTQIVGSSDADRGAIILPVGGSYVLLVEGRYESAGASPFSFNLRPVTETPRALTIGTTTTGSIAGAGDGTSFTFTLDAPRSLIFDALATAGTLANGYSLTWTLSGPRGVEAGNRFLYSDSGYLGGSPLLALAAGTYSLRFAADGDATGSFDFSLLDIAAATPITPGTPVTGTLAPGSATQMYRFEASAGDPFFFDAQGNSGYYPTWRLLDPYGNQIFFTDLSTDRDTTVLRYAGTYTLLVEGRPESRDGTDTFTFTVVPNPVQTPIRLTDLEGVPGPDLQVQDLQVTAAGGIRSGGAITIAWTDANAGTRETGAGWQDRVLIRRADTNEILVNTLVAAPANLAAANGLPRSLTVTLPDGNRGAGELVVTITADVANAIEEQGAGGTAETNNSATTIVTAALAPYADLAIAGLGVSPPAGWREGDDVTVFWTTRNDGTLAAASAAERLIIRNEITNTIVYSGNLALSGLIAGGTEARSLVVSWPGGSSSTGRFVFTVEADFGNAVFEANAAGTAEANNAAAVTLASAPELRVVNLRVTTDDVHSGGPLAIAWETRNDGNAATPVAWQDRVRVVNLDTGAVLYDAAIGDAAGLGALAPGAERGRAASLTLPQGAAGAGRLAVTVTADQTPAGLNAIIETNEGDNLAALEVTAALSLYADLAPTAIVVPATARGGSLATFGWTVSNLGGVDTDITGWSDRVVLSTDTVLGNGDDVVLANVARAGVLAAGASYVAEASVLLPER
ncbi:MAG: hypothetical protein ACOYOH_27560, partial [Paracraurococcus sp.]